MSAAAEEAVANLTWVGGHCRVVHPIGWREFGEHQDFGIRQADGFKPLQQDSAYDVRGYARYLCSDELDEVARTHILRTYWRHRSCYQAIAQACVSFDVIAIISGPPSDDPRRQNQTDTAPFAAVLDRALRSDPSTSGRYRGGMRLVRATEPEGERTDLDPPPARWHDWLPAPDSWVVLTRTGSRSMVEAASNCLNDFIGVPKGGLRSNYDSLPIAEGIGSANQTPLDTTDLARLLTSALGRDLVNTARSLLTELRLSGRLDRDVGLLAQQALEGSGQERTRAVAALQALVDGTTRA